MFRSGGHFNPDGSFDFHGSWTGTIPPCSPSYPQPRIAIIGASSKGPMKGRSCQLEVFLERPALVHGLTIPSSLSGVLIEQIRTDDHLDLIMPTKGRFDGVVRDGVPYEAIRHAQENYGGALSRTMAQTKVTITVRRCPVNFRWRLEVRSTGNSFTTKLVQRRFRDNVPSRKSHFFAAIECTVLDNQLNVESAPYAPYVVPKNLSLDEMKELYREVTEESGCTRIDLDLDGDRYVVRTYDEVDDLWDDSETMDVERALSTWTSLTERGTRSTSLKEALLSKSDGNDYDEFWYTIVLAGTPMPIRFRAHAHSQGGDGR